MVRAAAKNHASVAVVTVAGRRTRLIAARSATGGFTLAQRRALAARAFADIAEYDVAVAELVRRRSWRRPSDWLAGVRRAGAAPVRRCCATARTRTRRPRSTSTRRAAPGWPRPSSCTARRCPTTTTSTPTPPGGPRTTSPSRRWRSSSTPTRAASRSAPTSPRRTARRTPATRCRRSAASSRSTGRSRVELAEQVAEIFTEVIVAPAFDDGRGRGPAARKKNLRLLRAPACDPPPVELRQVDRRRAGADRATGSTPPGDDPANWQLATGEAGRRGDAAPTSRSPGGRSAR